MCCDEGGFKSKTSLFLLLASYLGSTMYLVRGELGDGLGALGHGVLGELTREDEADRGLDLAAGEGRLLVVAGQAAGLHADALEHVVDERVHDRHAALGDAGLRVDLLEDLVDVDRVALDAAAAAGGGAALLAGLLGGSLGHGCECV